MSAEATKEVRDEIARGALRIQNDIRHSIQKGPKSGRTYRRGAINRTKKGRKGDRRVKASAYRFHRASAPGQAPATDTGRLVSHIVTTYEKRGLRAHVGVHDLSNIKYAKRLEFGGRDKRGVYIAPRPYIRPALVNNGPAIIARIRSATKKVLK